MTDPRMTPTNDAPMTVEPDDCPYCGGAEEVLAVVSDGSQDYIPCPHPCHRLAALASAPAGDGPARIDHGASEALGEMVWTTAPAGDGVDAATRMMRDCADDLVSTASHHGQYAAIDQDKIDGLRDAVRDYDAALARPRAAVGEQSRRAMERAVHDLLCRANITAYLDMPEDTPEKIVAAILALQSPPAKVEGRRAALARMVASDEELGLYDDPKPESEQ